MPELKDIQIPIEMTEIPYEITPHLSTETKTWWIGSNDTGIPYNCVPRARQGITSIPSTGTVGDFFLLNNYLYIWDDSNNAFISAGQFTPKPMQIQANTESGWLEWSDDGGNNWANMIQIVDIKGDKGDTGDSAYEDAVQNGYTGTEAQWLESLGAYGIAKKNGYIGTEAQWVQSLSDHINDYVFDSDTKVFINRDIGTLFYHYGQSAPIGAVQANGEEYDGTIYQHLLQHAIDHNLIKTEAEWQALAAKNDSVPYFTAKNAQGKFRVPKEVFGVWVPDWANADRTNKITTNNGTWTVESNGFIRASVVGASTGNWNSIHINGIRVDSSGTANYHGDTERVFAVKTGDVIKLSSAGFSAQTTNPWNENTATWTGCYFIPPKFMSMGLTNILPCIQAFGPTDYASQTAYEAWVANGNVGSLEDFFEALTAYGVARDVMGYTGTTAQWLDTLTAYGVAKTAGYTGTVTEWLESLKGLTAFEVAQESGYTGTQAQWLESLKGADGSGVNILGVFENTSQLPTVASSNAGDAYLVGEDLWVLPSGGTAFVNAGPIRGPIGNTGATGPIGPTGAISKIISTIATVGALPVTGQPGNMHVIARGATGEGDLYQWNENTAQWDKVGNILGPVGPTGPIGAALTFAQLTPEQREDLRGEVGPTGPTGATGASGTPAKDIELVNGMTHMQWRYVGTTTPTNIKLWSELIGPVGATGATGATGPYPHIRKNTENGKIEVSRDNQATWDELITIAELQGPVGDTPMIHPATKTWTIAGTDTGIKAEGDKVTIDETTSHWFIDGVDTGVGALGTQLAIDPVSNNWLADGVDTGHRAVGLDSFWTAIIDGTKLYASTDGVNPSLNADNEPELLFDFANVTFQATTPLTNTFYTSFNSGLQAVNKPKAKVIVDGSYNPAVQNNQEQGIDLAPYKTLASAMEGKAAIPAMAQVFDIYPGTYTENLTVTAITNRTFQGYSVGKQHRTTITGNVSVSGLSGNISFRDLIINGDLRITASAGNYEFDNVQVTGTVTLAGNGYAHFNKTSFADTVTVSGSHTVKIDDSEFTNGAMLDINNASAFVNVNSSTGLTVHGYEGNYHQTGNTINILNNALSGAYCMIFESSFTSVNLAGGLAYNEETDRYMPIQVKGPATAVTLGLFQFEQNISTIMGVIVPSGLQATQVMDKTVRDGYTTTDQTVKGNLDAIAAKLMELETRLATLEE